MECYYKDSKTRKRAFSGLFYPEKARFRYVSGVFMPLYG